MRRIVGQEKPDILSLEHFGVKGMHWGVRKSSPSSATPRQKFQLSDRQKTLLKIGVVAIPLILQAFGPSLASSVVAKAEYNRGLSKTAQILADQTLRVSAKRGVFNVTTM